MKIYKHESTMIQIVERFPFAFCSGVDIIPYHHIHCSLFFSPTAMINSRSHYERTEFELHNCKSRNPIRMQRFHFLKCIAIKLIKALMSHFSHCKLQQCRDPAGWLKTTIKYNSYVIAIAMVPTRTKLTTSMFVDSGPVQCTHAVHYEM